MTISTNLSGYWRRYDGDNVELQRRLSESVTVTEYSGNKIAIAAGSSNISLRPQGLSKITAFYIETDGKINVQLTGDMNASINIHSTGILAFVNSSLNDIKLSNQCATVRNVFFDLSG